MEEIVLKAQVREQTGKGAAKRLRKRGMIPAVYYTAGEEPILLVIEERDLTTAIGSHRGIVHLKINGNGKHECIFREIQTDPVRGELIHVDLMGVKRGRKISVEVPVVLVGAPIGVREEGGITEHILTEIEISCLPRHLPDQLEVDVSGLNVGDTLHVRDLSYEHLEILTNNSQSVVTIGHPAKVVEAIPEEEEAEVPEVEAEEKAPTEEAEPSEEKKEK